MIEGNSGTENSAATNSAPAATTQAAPAVQQPAQVTQQQQPAAQQPLPGTEASDLAATLANLGGFMSAATKAEMEKAIGSQVNPDTVTEEQPNGTQNQPAAQESTTQQQQETPAAVEKTDAPAAAENKSRLFKNKPVAKPAEQVIENIDHILGVVKGNFGMELKTPAELPKFFETATTWRKDAEQFKKIEPQHKALLAEIEALPAEFHEAFQLMSKGEDYTKPFASKPKFDYNLPAEKQDVQALVNHYYPGKFTEEDFKDPDAPEILQFAKTSALDKFNLEKTAYDSKRAAIAENATKQLAAFKTSVTSSVQDLERSFPDMDKDTVKEVSSILEGGPQSVLSFFFNNDGSAKTDAAKRLMLARYGEEEIQGMMEIAQHTKETEINTQMLTRGADKPAPVQRSSTAAPQISEEEKQKIEELKKLGKKTNTY